MHLALAGGSGLIFAQLSRILRAHPGRIPLQAPKSTQMLDFLLYYLVLNVYSSLITWKFFTANGKPAWSAWVPVYRTYVLTQLADRPRWWTFLCYIPVVDNVMSIILTYELLHMHGFRENKHIYLSIATLGLYVGYLNYSAEWKPGTRDDAEIRRRMPATVNHILFAVVAAGAIRMTSFEAYNIPTGSMEKTLMVGDYLFVSKMHYGLRLPNTPLSIPLMHNLIPYTQIASYLDWIELPYVRIPGWTQPQKGDAVVFNFPADPDRPVDKKENYVKQCVGTPGDTLKIVDRQVYTNGEARTFGERSNPQWSYYVRTNGQGFNPAALKRNYDINYLDNRLINNQNLSDVIQITETEYFITISQEMLAAFSAQPNIDTIVVMNSPGDNVFPEGTPPAIVWYNDNAVAPGVMFPNPDGHQDSTVFPYSRDNYGPIWIPAKGQSVELNYQTVLTYGRAIREYEGHELELRDGVYYLDGEAASNYTFAMDYYWMMGDNRHNSWDSRYWGFVPEDHIVGKPVFIFFSSDQFIEGFLSSKRWERFFTVVHGDGQPTSYLWPFVLLVALYYSWDYYRKRKAAK